MKNSLRTIPRFSTGIVCGIFIMFTLAFNGERADSKVSKQNAGAPSFQWSSPALPSKLSFAGEAVPLDRWDVKERLDRELLFNYYSPNNILYILKLSHRYFPMIEAKLKAHGVPEDFKYLCVAESNLQNAVSKAGASGFWQFMKNTAPGYDMEVNKTVDERYHVEKATDAACKYLKTAYQKFGSWTAAAASYNCGMGGYKDFAEFQKTNNYYDLQLPEETNKYIFRILAFKHLLQDAEKNGFTLNDEQVYKPVKTRVITVTESINNLAEFAISHGSNYKMLKILNPWLRERSLHVKRGTSYYIHLPADEATAARR